MLVPLQWKTSRLYTQTYKDPSTEKNTLMGNYMARIRRKYTHGNEDVEARSKMEEIFIQWYVHTVG
jgi:hypothetical protein